MQKYFSINDVTLELRRVAEKKVKGDDDVKSDEKMKDFVNVEEKSGEVFEKSSTGSVECGGGELIDEVLMRDDSLESEITDTGKYYRIP